MLAFKSNGQNFSVGVLFLVCRWAGAEGGRGEQGTVRTPPHAAGDTRARGAAPPLLRTPAAPRGEGWCFARYQSTLKENCSHEGTIHSQ